MGLRGLNVEISYSGWGKGILDTFVLPGLKEAIQYDRITSFFTTDSLVAIAAGLDALWAKRGVMRLVVGVHDVPGDLLEAATGRGDFVDSVIAEVRARVLAEVSTIQDEMARERLATIAWMMQDGFVEVRVVVPASVEPGPPGLFHNKMLVFRDGRGDSIVGVGSPNETGAGLGGNFEHLTVFSSWGQPDYVLRHVDFFETLWGNRQEGLVVRELDKSFADEILQALSQPVRPTGAAAIAVDAVDGLLEMARNMPALSLLAGGHAPLYPHQERVYVDALSRWPVRVMLADEVGLGKTFESAAVLSYLLRHGGAHRVVLLVPKALVHQWQAELKENFGLDAWVFDSGKRAFLSSAGEERAVFKGEPLLSSRTPDITVFSAQYARGTRKGGHVFKDSSVLPDILVVDEAHAARVRPENDGSERPTLMWRMLKDLTKQIPHVVFATATPIQVHWREYHGLLELLGLPNGWRRPQDYERSLHLLVARGSSTLSEASALASLVHSSVTEMRLRNVALSPEESLLVREIMVSHADVVDRAHVVQKHWHYAQRVLAKTHPAHFLTLRNTRQALEKVGYRFPERRLEAPALNVPDEVRSFYLDIEDYLKSVYYEVEQTLSPEKTLQTGFVRSSYQQRLASSLEACLLSLQRRKERVETIKASAEAREVVLTEVDDLEEADFFDDLEAGVGGDYVATYDPAAVLRAASIEIQWLDGLLRQIRGILETAPDPKISEALRLIDHHLELGDSVLVFSRYTDTLDCVMRAFSISGSGVGYGLYTGQTAGLHYGRGFEPASRGQIREALDRGLIQVVFCSDAASEGLNLQAARVLINVDVPWNPAKLEQRIGRVARLGQRATSVQVYNLWYPDSVEARMYERLMARHELWAVAVGEFPEVISAAIRDELASRYGSTTTSSDPVMELQRLRRDTQSEALKRLWAHDPGDGTLTDKARREIASAACLAAEEAGGSCKSGEDSVVVEVDGEGRVMTLGPGGDGAVSLAHPALKWLAARSVDPTVVTHAWYAGGVPAFFGHEAGGDVEVVAPTSVPELIKRAAGLAAEEPLGLVASGDEVLGTEWLPDHSRLTVPCDLDCHVPDPPEYTLGRMELRRIQSEAVTE